MSHVVTAHQTTPYTLDRHFAPAFWYDGSLWLALAASHLTGGRLSLVEQEMRAGKGQEAHRNVSADKAVYVLEGQCTFEISGLTIAAGPGTFIHLPRTVIHSYHAASYDARVLNFFCPAGVELITISCGTFTKDVRIPRRRECKPVNTDQLRMISEFFGQEMMPAPTDSQAGAEGARVGGKSDSPASSVHVSNASEVSSYEAFGLNWRILAGSTETNGAYDLFHIELPFHGRLPPRMSSQDEVVYVLHGLLDIWLNGKSSILSENCFAFVPSGSVSAAEAGVFGARILLFRSPGGLDQALRSKSPSDSGVQSFLETMGTVFLPRKWQSFGQIRHGTSQPTEAGQP